MDWKTILHKGILRGGICILLSAAIVLGLVLPGTNMKPAKPKDPLAEESIREISVLKVGENISELQTIVVPNGGSAAPTEPDDEMSEETDPEETQPNETVPQETQSEEPDIGEGEEGNEDDQQGEEGGEELNLDLAAVLTWYRYGNEPKTITCAPSRTVAKTLNTAQLKNNVLKYRFDLTGEDAKYVQITSVTLAEGDSAYHEIAENGTVEIQLPGGNGDRNYSFEVTALAEKKNDAGETIQQQIQFFFILKCEFTMDLNLELTWTQKDGSERVVACRPDQATAFSVQNYELNEKTFLYKMQLQGSLADNAQIVEASYTTASGVDSGTLQKESGELVLAAAPGTNTETYYLSFTVKSGERMVLYTYNLVYQEQLDVELSFTWEEGGVLEHTRTCAPGGKISERIKNNQLSAGVIPYRMELTGADAEGGEIISVTCASDTGSSLLNHPEGTLPMTMPEGGSTNTYHLTINARVGGQRMTFEVLLYYANDVTLQIDYSVTEEGSKQQRRVACENGKTRTAEVVYDDQLVEGKLDYTMSVVGSDAESVSISSVTFYQSGNGRTVNVEDAGEVKLLLNNGRSGENTFRVEAQDNEGNSYQFTINIPYKHRGENNIQIQTNLKDGQQVINGTKTNLSVKAWSEDTSGHVLNYIPANGVDTKLIVKLDERELSYISTSGTSSEYDLVPENPEEGDTNDHILSVYAEDAFGNYGELTLTLKGQRRDPGQKVGTATVQVDLTVLGLGIVSSLKYDVLADEPVSYVAAKALMGEDTGDPFGAATESFGWNGIYRGTLDRGFYLERLDTGHTANALEGEPWPGFKYGDEAVLAAIDERFGAGSNLAILWRCIYRNGLTKSEGIAGSFGEFDYTSDSGWVYSVGTTNYYPGQAMSAVYLQDGDVLTFRFTLAKGWDVGAGSPGYGKTVGYCITGINGNFDVDHQMETVVENGVEKYVCHCCGIVQNCMHSNTIYKDLGDGTHVKYCNDCLSSVGDVEEHELQNDEERDAHICGYCNFAESHSWRLNKTTNTASCTEPGEGEYRCMECGYTKWKDTPPKGHADNDEWNYTTDLKLHYWTCHNINNGVKCDYRSEPENHTFVYDSDEKDNICTACGLQHDSDALGTDCSGEVVRVLEGSTCLKVRYICACGNTLTLEDENGGLGDFHDEMLHHYRNGYCELCYEADPYYEPEEPTEEPTEAPTEEPTEAPTEAPTEEPTEEPTEAPTEEPTEAPTEAPTEEPTEEPTEAPTEEPDEDPSEPEAISLFSRAFRDRTWMAVLTNILSI